MTLHEFLTARLDEEEQTARTCERLTWESDNRIMANSEGGGVWVLGDDGDPVAITQFATAEDGEGIDPRTIAEFIARHDPARVLREITAKRGILEFFERADGDSAWWYEDAVLGQLASVYADHPDYQQGWAP